MFEFKNTAEIMNEFNTGLEHDIIITQEDVDEAKAESEFFANLPSDEHVAEQILIGMDGSRSFNAVRDLHI